MKIEKNKFGTTLKGEKPDLFVLSNDFIQVSVSNFGGIISDIKTPDKHGKQNNIVLGFDSVEEYQSKQYLKNCHYFGCIIGRVCNRISKGQFTLNGIKYQLPINNEDRHIHGGIEGFDKKLWTAEKIQEHEKVGVKLTYLSADGDEGYPGNLQTTVNYFLTKNNELHIEYFAKTDRPTIINLTNHSYFNLSGGTENILDHFLTIPASKYTELDNLMPTGKILEVKSTPYDFRNEIKIGEKIDLLPDGYDINFPLDSPTDGTCRFAGKLSDKKTGRFVTVFTTQPAIQIYAGYYIPELIVDGKKKFGKYSGFALETQHFADAINHPNFPSIVLNPGEEFYQKTIYQFGINKE